VLLVEDDAATRVFLAENLIAGRFAPVSATSGEEAMAMLAGPRPDVAVVDVVLPWMSGLDLVGTIRAGGSAAAPRRRRAALYSSSSPRQRSESPGRNGAAPVPVKTRPRVDDGAQAVGWESAPSSRALPVAASNS
jgi:CheY-like chemotaxis protein